MQATEDIAASTRPTEQDQPATAGPRGRNVMSLAGSQVVSWSVTLAWTFIVPQRIGPSGWGMLVTGSAVAGLLGVLVGFGTRTFLVRELIRAPHAAAPFVGTALALRLLLLLPATVLLLAYLRISGFESQQQAIVLIAAAGIYFTVLAEPFEAVFQAVERMEYLAAGTLVDRVGQSLGAIGLVLLGFGVMPLALWSLGVGGFVFALRLVWSRRFVRPAMRPGRPALRAHASGSLPYWTMGLFLTVYLWIDSAMLATLAPPEVVGWYGIPLRLLGTCLFGINMLATLWLPRLVTAHETDRAGFAAFARVPVEQALVTSFPLALGGAAVAGPLIGIFGPEFADAVPILVILALGVIPISFNVMAYQLLVAMGRQKVWTKVVAGATVINPVFNFFAIRACQDRYGNGAIGAAASLIATELVMAGASCWVLRDFIVRSSIVRALRALAAALVMGALVYEAEPFGLAVQLGLGVVVFTVAALVLKVPTAGELGMARAALRTARARAVAATGHGPGPRRPPS